MIALSIADHSTLCRVLLFCQHVVTLVALAVSHTRIHTHTHTLTHTHTHTLTHTHSHTHTHTHIHTHTAPPVCENGDIQLIGGEIPTEGTIQICLNQQWGTVCDDFWQPQDANVVCRQLGFIGNIGEAIYIRTRGIPSIGRS